MCWTYALPFSPAHASSNSIMEAPSAENELAERLRLERNEVEMKLKDKERQLSDTREKFDEQLKTNEKLLEKLQVKEAEV